MIEVVYEDDTLLAVNKPAGLLVHRSAIAADETDFLLERLQVQIGGTADSSAIYLHAVAVNGGTHDVFFVTTTYGKTVAVDAASGAVLWTFTPPGYSSWAGSPQITTATPVADPSRRFIYAASPGGVIYKLAVANGHSIWGVSITKLPSAPAAPPESA